ncbi:hypothetical protein MMC30_008607 [Trapelia coarctata]|nr:hypothetical protein [Trapelia coarctata]
MTLVDMDSVQFWQPPPATCSPSNGRLTASNTSIIGAESRTSAALRPSYKPSKGSQDDDPIEIIDITASLPKECSDPSSEPVPDLTDVEANAEDTTQKPWFLRGSSRSVSEKSDDFPTVKELLSCNKATPDSRRKGGRCIGVHTRDRSIIKGNRKGQASPDTQPTSVSGLKARSTPFRRNLPWIPETPSPCRNGLLSSTPSEETGTSNNESQAESNPRSAVESSCDRWDEGGPGAEAEEEAEPYGNRDKHETPLLSLTRKRLLPMAEGEPRVRRYMKRPCFMSPVSPDEEFEIGGESKISDVISPKLRRPNRCPASQAAVIYEQQKWEGKIIGERDVKQRRGRPRKQYLVQWEPFWVDCARLTAPELLQSWKKQKTGASKVLKVTGIS